MDAIPKVSPALIGASVKARAVPTASSILNIDQLATPEAVTSTCAAYPSTKAVLSSVRRVKIVQKPPTAAKAVIVTKTSQSGPKVCPQALLLKNRALSPTQAFDTIFNPPSLGRMMPAQLALGGGPSFARTKVSRIPVVGKGMCESFLGARRRRRWARDFLSLILLTDSPH